MARKREEEFPPKSVYGDGVAWCRGPMIGKGSFGFVYSSTLKNPTSKYSCFPPVMAVKSAEVSVSDSIQKEKEVLSNLGYCEDIIGCFGDEITTSENGMMAYNLLLEYASGGTLSDKIKKSGGSGLPEPDVKMYTRSILRGLNHIHGTGYVHCDMKPQNILLVHDGRRVGVPEYRAVIADFGLAKRVKQRKRRLVPYWRGTPLYLSPEAVMDKVQEPPSDIWALGCVVVEMLTGKYPWDEKGEISPEEVLQKIGGTEELPKVPSELSTEAREFLRDCFVRNPDNRMKADMLLNHPFLEGLEYDPVVNGYEDEELSETNSSTLASDSDEDHSHGSHADD